MALTSGVLREISYSKESAFGVKPEKTGAKRLRRVTAEINLERETFESAEITSTAQTSDMRSGTDSVKGSLNGEVSPGSYSDFFASLLRGTWENGVTTGSIELGCDGNGKFTDAANGFVTAGFKVGDVIKVDGFTAPGFNGVFTVSAVAAGELTVSDMKTGSPEVAAAGKTISVLGKKLVIPLNGSDRTNDSYSIESWFSNLSISEVATGVKISECEISVQPNAMATNNFTLMGRTVEQGDTRYFTNPTPPPTASVLAGSKGALYLSGQKIAIVSAFSLNISGNMESATIVGARQAPDIFLGRVKATGEMSMYFENNTVFQNFVNETDMSVVFTLFGDGEDMFAIKLPRIKLGGASKNDAEVGGVIQTVPFTALLPKSSTTEDQSTVVLQENITV